MSKLRVRDEGALRLPADVITRRDLARLISSFEDFDDELTDADIRARSGDEAKAPGAPEQVQALIDHNQPRSVDSPSTRQQILKELRKLQSSAPVFYVRTAAELSPDDHRQLSAWFRESVDEKALLDFGIQPALVGGVYIRSENKVFDFSWRQNFANKRGVVADKLRELIEA